MLTVVIPSFPVRRLTTPRAGHDWGHRVLEDIVFVIKERSSGGTKKCTYVAQHEHDVT